MRIRRGDDPGPFSDPGNYKPALRDLFQHRCAYCRTPDSRANGLEGMTVDHFLPITRRPDLRVAWRNLYYACVVCNSHYKKDRPTLAEEAKGERFVDPCKLDPDNHFRLRRATSGRSFVVIARTKPGRFTVRTLCFNERTALRDWWMELDQEQAETESQFAQIGRCITRATATTADSPKRDEVNKLLAALRQMEADCKARVVELQDQWPFPVNR